MLILGYPMYSLSVTTALVLLEVWALPTVRELSLLAATRSGAGARPNDSGRPALEPAARRAASWRRILARPARLERATFRSAT